MSRINRFIVAIITCCFVFGLVNTQAQTWTEVKVTPTPPSVGAGFGGSVCIDGNYAIVGSECDNNCEGAAYIFERTGGTWVQKSRLTFAGSSPLNFHYFGYSVSLSGDCAVVGAMGAQLNKGAAYVFVKPSGGWPPTLTQTAMLTASNGAQNDAFGGAVSISGDYVIIGAQYHDGSVPLSGSAYIFEKPSGGWTDMTQKQELNASNGQISDYFGGSVCISGDYAIVGASYSDKGTVTNSGSRWLSLQPPTSKQTTDLAGLFPFPGTTLSLEPGVTMTTVLTQAQPMFSSSHQPDGRTTRERLS